MEQLLDHINKENPQITLQQMGLIIQRVFLVQPKRKMLAGKKQAHYPLQWISKC